MPKSKIARRRKKSKSVPVEAHVHKKERRVNIPTAELQDFVKEDETRPKKMLYPRDPSLDPQLVWRGKDEQDAKDLEVPVVPVYIQEKIHPRHLIEDLEAFKRKDRAEQQIDLFSDFNGLDFERLIDFYRHSQHWTNRMILGDSLLVMTSLAEKEGLKGQVQMIYIDPPYGIKFGSNWQVSTRKRDVKDGKVEDATRQPEQIKAFRDTWELGIHSYLAYLRDRLVAARELLTESGSVFVQIGDENVHLVRSLLDEVFGSENFGCIISFATSTGSSTRVLPRVTDYVIWYCKNAEVVKFRQLYGDQEEAFSPHGSDDRGEYELASMTSQHPSDTRGGVIKFQGKEFIPSEGRQWSCDPTFFNRLVIANRVVAVSAKQIRWKKYKDERARGRLSNIWEDTQFAGFSSDKTYVVQTHRKVIERCLLMTTDPGDLVFDPTCGSGTTAYVAEQWGRRWITIDTSRVALALARTRLMAARFPYYILSDSREGVLKEAEITGHVPPSPIPDGEKDLRRGFIYKRVPHVTLKSIANNPDIKEGMKREEIDAAIALHAETELLYDQPYEDNSRIRVSGPFTVESLSPHRVMSDESKPSTATPEDRPESSSFVHIVIENLKKAGVENTVKKERLKFDRLESYTGVYVQAAGEYTEGGKSKRVAVAIGPEHGTVGSDLVKEAAKESVKGAGFDLLVVCGLAFDPYVGEEAKQFGKLTVLKCKVHNDLAMGDDFLKKTGTGNLFMVFGEPDIDITKHPAKNGDRPTVTVEIRGVDVYDPTTGAVRGHSTDDIACWFIDTDYNDESFFVRHAYFCSADRPYEKLQKSLRATINESVWSSLYATKSRPFPAPKTRDKKPGKIAVKVINHYGDEVMKVYTI